VGFSGTTNYSLVAPCCACPFDKLRANGKKVKSKIPTVPVTGFYLTDIYGRTQRYRPYQSILPATISRVGLPAHRNPGNGYDDHRLVLVIIFGHSVGWQTHP